jgi:hypothetical protein
MEQPIHRMTSILEVLTIWLLAGVFDAAAGPPLVVDDPDTLDRGHFELFTSFLYDKSGTLRTYAAPTELTIGLAKGWECSINGAYEYNHDESTTPNTVNGVLSLDVGTKFRLLTESPNVPISLAVSGHFRFPTSSNSKFAEQGKPSGSGTLVLARTLGDFALLANVGFGLGGLQNRAEANDTWFFGLAAQRIFAKKYTIFGEVHSTPQVGRFRDAVVNVDGGLLWDLSDRYRISVLLGRGFGPGGADFIVNIGFLLSLGPKPPAARLEK